VACIRSTLKTDVRNTQFRINGYRYEVSQILTAPAYHKSSRKLRTCGEVRYLRKATSVDRADLPFPGCADFSGAWPDFEEAIRSLRNTQKMPSRCSCSWLPLVNHNLGEQFLELSRKSLDGAISGDALPTVSFRQRCVVEVETGRSRGYFGFLLAGLTLRKSLSHL
jgi:hypothetical protein